jgi:hypothetical protein
MVAFAAVLAVSGCGGGNTGGGSSAPPASGVVTVYPGTASVPPDTHTQVQFSAFLAGQPSATFTWSVSGGSSNGTINASTGVYTPPSSVPSPATVTITATDSSSTTETGTATITIVATQGVTVSPAALALPAGTSATFSATTSGNPVTPTWEVNGVAGGSASVGTITNAGVYTAPLTPPSGGSVTITAVHGAANGTAAATIVFSNNSLSGSYAFLYSGSDQNAHALVVAGSFTANAATSGISVLEDYINPASSILAQALSLTGTYQVNPDGSGSVALKNPDTTAGTETWQLALVGGNSGGVSPHALLVRLDNTATGSGTIDLQNTAQLDSLSSISGNYVFRLAGVDASGYALEEAGIFNADGVGNIPLNSGEEDINDGGNDFNFGEPFAAVLLNGTYSLDSSHPGSGRGYITLNSDIAGLSGAECAFYAVDSAHLKLIEIDNAAILAGDVYAAPNTAPGSYQLSSFSGHYAFTLSGADVNSPNPYTQGGVLIANGRGGITGGVMDVNDGGIVRQLNENIANTSYTVDPNLGRIAFPITFGNTTIDYAGYAAANGSIQIVSLDLSLVDSGTAFPQTATSAPQGAFALNLTGAVSLTAGREEDVAGQITIPADGVSTGNLAINDPNSGRVAAGVPIESSTSIGATDSNGRGIATIASHLESFPLIYYTIDGNNVLLFESDKTRTIVGTLARQF